MGCLKNLDAWSGGGWGGIYSPQPPKQPLGMAAVDGRTRHCPVRQPRHPTVRVLVKAFLWVLVVWMTTQLKD
jgi:hypothetical protein